MAEIQSIDIQLGGFLFFSGWIYIDDESGSKREVIASLPFYIVE